MKGRRVHDLTVDELVALLAAHAQACQGTGVTRPGINAEVRLQWLISDFHAAIDKAAQKS